MKNTKKANVKQVLFYTAITTISYLGMIGIEAKANSIENIEFKISNKVDHFLKNEISENGKNYSEQLFANSDKDQNKLESESLILEYVVGKKSTGSFSMNKSIYYYNVSPKLEISIYDRYGVKQNNKDFKFELKKIDNNEYSEKNQNETLSQIQKENKSSVQIQDLINASPKEGMAAFRKNFIEASNFIIPKDIDVLKVVLKFTVEIDGSFSNIIVINEVDEENKNEAIRVLKLMPAWNSAQKNGENVASDFYMPINIMFNSN